MKEKVFFSLLIIILFSTFILFDEANAIPAFARRYKISCSTCHAPIPKLKPYGDDYAGAGFILKEEEKERDYVTAGDDMLWLNKDFPVAARFDAYATYEKEDYVENDLQVPYGLKLMSGGTLYKNIGYYFYFYMSEKGKVAGIEDAYIHFDNIFGSNLDVMVGQFQTSDPLMKRELRLTLEDYAIYKAHVGESITNLTYDRGLMLVYGIEKTGTDIVGLVVNGNGKGEAGENDKFDIDKFKNFGLRISQGIGKNFSIGGFYYSGKEIHMSHVAENELTYMGPDVNATIGPFEFTGQYLIREDTSPLFFTYKVQDIKTEGIVAELIFSPKLDRSRWYLTALYNKISSDIDDYKQEMEEFGGSALAYETATLSGTYLLSRNLRLVAEYTRDMEKEANKFSIGFVTAY